MKKISWGGLSSALAALLLTSGVVLAQSGAPRPADAKPATTQRAPATEKLDINSATAAELEQLKGIGPVRAEAIVKGRPYKGKDDLVRMKIIPQSVYDEISDQIIAKQK
jgi:DNA uptake protein ComE-like DNA-binding protein